MTSIVSRKQPLAAHGEIDAFDRHWSVPGLAAANHVLWKSAFDRALAVIMLVPALPLIALLVLLVRLTSRGPGVYRQKRVGRGGRIFTMYKLRSMRTDAEAASGPVWADVGTDSRVTPIGSQLRRFHLDELPQLYNVLRGEMSLVGPRPERPEFVAVLAQQIPGYTSRLQVLPGITGLAQINLPPDTDLDSVRRKLVLDREYIEHIHRFGPWFDLRIILCTLLRLIGLRGGRAVRLFGLQRMVVLTPDHAAGEQCCKGAVATPAALAAGTEHAGCLASNKASEDGGDCEDSTCPAALQTAVIGEV